LKRQKSTDTLIDSQIRIQHLLFSQPYSENREKERVKGAKKKGAKKKGAKKKKKK